MTESCQIQLRNGSTDAIVMLSDKMETEFPNPIPDIATLQTLKRLVSKTTRNANFLIDQIENGQFGWLKVQSSLSVNERAEDLKIYQSLIKETEFPSNLYKLRAYIRDLNNFKEELDEILSPKISLTPLPIRKATARLPPPILPAFSGNIEEWPSFWQRYKNLIHDVDPKELADSTKMDVLLNECLRDKAHRVVAHFSLDESEYPRIISYLHSEFGNDLALKESLIHALQILKPTTGKREDLHQFVDELEQICSRLERAGESPETLSTQTLITTKLPRFLQEYLLNARRNLPCDIAWTTAKMRECLKEKVRQQEELARLSKMTKNLTLDPTESKNMSPCQ